jgi:hypothetical protein
MKLIARLYALNARLQQLLAAWLPGDAVPTSARFPVDIDDPVFARILAAGDAEKGAFWVGGETVFTPAELAGIGHFELVCRAVARESPADFSANDAVRGRTPLVDAGGAAPIRIVSELSLTRITLKPNRVASIGDWTQEYVLGAGVIKTFIDARLTGASFLPLMKMNGKARVARTDFVQLFSDAIMRPAIVDASVERITSRFPEEDGFLRHLGCLAYTHSALENRPDFNRTAEPWGGFHGWPSWVVSARVRDVFMAGKLRGWHFRPVLVAKTELYAEYVKKWSALRSAVAASRSKMDGGRW